MREFAVRAEPGVVGFSPVRALIATGDTLAWPPAARAGLRLVAPDDPACPPAGNEGSRAGPEPERPARRERIVADLREVARAWYAETGPCRVEVAEADRLDDGTRLFLAVLLEVSGGTVVVRCPAGDTAVEPLPPVRPSDREARLERLSVPTHPLTAEQAGHLCDEAAGYLVRGDGWTAERLLRAVLRQWPAPEVWAGLREACTLLGRPLDPRRPVRRQPAVRPSAALPHLPAQRRALAVPPPQPAAARGVAVPGRRPLRLDSGWEVLESWAETAGQIDKNAVHKALFALADRTVFRDYETRDDGPTPLDLTVRVREGLVLKVRIRDLDTFDITGVGVPGEAPGIGRSGTGRMA
ncbi:DUF6235 family protein [Streptomyces sp. NPDC097619]|uniref:DUF6235 family protein n=1 Tax=Streptomyces sp. NPDC097619 TaxID=3157228 RepID=UPI00332EA2E0